MANKHVRDTKLHQSHMTLALNNNPSWSNKNKIKSSRTRDHEQYVHTIKTYQNSQINQSTGTPSSTKKHYTLDSHNQRQWQTWLLTLNKPQHIRDNLEFLFFKKKKEKNPCKTAYLKTITNLPHQGGSNCLKKKTRERERGRRVHKKKNEAPTPPGSIKKQSSPEKRGRKGRNPAVEDRRIKTSSVPSEPSSG